MVIRRYFRWPVQSENPEDTNRIALARLGEKLGEAEVGEDAFPVPMIEREVVVDTAHSVV